MRTLLLAALVAVTAPALSAQSLFLDPSFDGGEVFVGSGTTYTSQALVVDAKDRAVSVYGTLSAQRSVRVRRISPDGTFDTDFGTPELMAGRYGSVGLAVLSDDGLLAFGRTGTSSATGTAGRLWTARLAEDGSAVYPFRDYAAPGDSAYTDATAAVEVGDGFVLAVRSVGSEGACGLLRLDGDGAVEATFGTDGTTPVFGGLPCSIARLALDDDGALLVAATVGDADIEAESDTDLAVTRVFADGSLDTAFGTDGVVRVDFEEGQDRTASLGVAADGTLLVAGSTSKGGLVGKLVLRLDGSGQRLGAFGSDGLVFLSGPDGRAFGGTTAAFLEADGGVTVHGVLNTPDGPGSHASSAARLQADGSLDLAFGDTGFDRFRALGVDINGPFGENQIRRDGEGRTLLAYTSGRTNSRQIRVARYLSPPPASTAAEHADALSARIAVAPNPTAGRTTVTVTLAAPAALRADVLDALGRRVARLAAGPRAAGSHALAFDASALPAGVYVLRVTAGNRVQTQRLTVAR